MSFDGSNQFGRPMRPDRIEMVRQTAEAVARDKVGQNLASESESFESFVSCITWNIYGALAEQWPDTMIAEVQAGMVKADEVCRVEYTRFFSPFSIGK